MATYYVNASTGSNNNAGTSTGTAWRTLDHALGNLTAGDTLNLMDDAVFDLSGTGDAITFSESGTDGNEITIQAYSGNTGYPIIDGGWRDTGYPDYRTASVSGQYGKLFWIKGSYVTVDGIAFKGSPARCVGVGDDKGLDSNKIACSNVTIKNCIMYENFASGLVFDHVEDGLAEDCEILYSSLRMFNRYLGGTTPDGTKIRNWPPPLFCPRSLRTTFRRCIVHDNGGEGIDLFACEECTAEYCISYNNGRTNYYIDWAGVDSQIVNCIAFNTDAHQAASPGGVGDHGISFRDEKAGSGAAKDNRGRTRRPVVTNNLIVNCGNGFQWATFANLENGYIAHNTIVNNTWGILFFGQPAADSSGARSWDGCIFENNLLYGNNRYGNGQTSAGVSNMANPPGVTTRNNLWDIRPSSGWRSSNDVYSDPNLADPDVSITSTLPHAYQRVANEFEAGDSYTLSFDKTDYYLGSGSPAISAAFRSSRVNIDIRDADRDNTPDIGCHEYNGEVTPVLSAGFTLSADQVTPGTTVNITSTASMTAGTIDTWAYHYSLDDAEWTSIGTSEDETFAPTADGEYRIRQTVTDTETADTKYYYLTLTVTSYDETDGGDTGTVPTAGNLLTNGDFSSGTTSWSKSGTVTWGTSGERLYVEDTSGPVYIQQSGFEMTDGDEYVIVLDMELTGNAGDIDRTVEIQVIQDGSPNDDVIERYTLTVPNNGGEQSYSDIVTQILGSTESDCRLRIKPPFLAAAQTLYIDNVVVAANIEVTAAFSADDSTPSVGQSVDFTDSSTGATSWQWYVKRSTEDDDGYDLFSTAQNPSWTVPSEGVYTVKLVAAQGNVTDSTTSTLTVDEWEDVMQRQVRYGIRRGLR